MESPLVTALVVSGIGLVVLFLALAALYGLMLLMTWALRDRPASPDARAREAVPLVSDARLQAAAVAIALARAEDEAGAAGVPSGEEPGSRWWSLHHQRQLTLRLRLRRGR